MLIIQDREFISTNSSVFQHSVEKMYCSSIRNDSIIIFLSSSSARIKATHLRTPYIATEDLSQIYN